MNFLPESVTNLIEELAKLPGIGPKSAQRLAFYILKSNDANISRLGESIINIKMGVKSCNICFALSNAENCKICSDSARNRSLICVVETTMDMLAIEKTCEYKGVYHVLNGKISPLDGIGPEDIRIPELFFRLGKEKIDEIILALNTDLEGETTSLYIQKQLATFDPLKVSRIARGLPSGGTLEYSDSLTLIRALEGRQTL